MTQRCHDGKCPNPGTTRVAAPDGNADDSHVWCDACAEKIRVLFERHKMPYTATKLD